MLPAPRRPAPHRPSRRLVGALALLLLGSSTVAGPLTPEALAQMTAGEAAAETGTETATFSPTAAPSDPSAGLAELQRELRRLIGQARDSVFPALVHIHTVTVRYFGGQEVKSNAVGSGTIFSPDGYVLTNQHVTAHGERFRCTLSDKRELPCDLVGEDPLTDLAVLRLELGALDGPASERPSGELPVAEFGDSSRLEVGDYVLAMGSPFALSRSVTLGIVSNSERVFNSGPGGFDAEDMELERGQRTGLFTRWIQHDALINPGNSGGPLVDLRGRVVGINELGGSSMGFAIPSDLARKVAAELIEHGEVPRSWIGVSFRPIDKTPYERGVLIDSVIADGPADRRLESGDLLLTLDGEPVEGRFGEQIPPLLKAIADRPIGSPLELTWERDGEEMSGTLVTARLDRDRGTEVALRDWGLVAQQITDKMARDRRLESADGVLVSSLRSGGPAQLAEPPLAEGDVVRSVEGEPVTDLEGLVAAYEEHSTDEEREDVLLSYDREGKSYVSLLRPREETERERGLELPKAWLGVATQPVVPSLAERMGVPGSAGYRITRVYPGTEAERAGLEVGDIVTGLEGNPLRPRGVEESGLLARRIRRLPIGSEALLTVLRQGEQREIGVELERTRPGPTEAARHRDNDFELIARAITFFDRDDRRWDEATRGVLVDQVESAGWAGLGGLRPGDLIQRFAGRRITDLESFEEALAATAEARSDRVEVVVLRGSRTRFLYLEPDWDPLEDAELASDPAALETDDA